MKPDIQLSKNNLTELAWDSAINATDVGVIVKDGVVTLTGLLASYAEKYAAERAARRLSGVKALAVEIEVRLTPSFKRTDSDIAAAAAAAAKHALEWNVTVPDTLQLKVENGWITLSGEVEWDFQRKAAERSVRNLFGVVGVSTLIKLKPNIACGDIEKSIHDALVRQAEQEVKGMQILVHGSAITLRGKMHSWAERRAAQGAAWAAQGVSSVANELTVAL
jgi:osmotically-inducible protein OsmY